MDVTVTTIQLRGKGDGGTVRLECELTWRGKAPVSEVSAGGVVALQLPKEERQTPPLKDGDWAPKVGRKSLWKPGETRKMSLTSPAIPKAAVDDKGREVFFAWITLDAAGEGFTYEAPIHSVDIQD